MRYSLCASLVALAAVVLTLGALGQGWGTLLVPQLARQVQAGEPAQGDGGSNADQSTDSGEKPKRDKTPPKEGKPGEAEEPPLLLDDEPPLLLDDEGEQEKPTKAMVDNDRCFVCHLNYKTEELALDHAKADVGCAKCHGNCDKHIADESWASGGNGTPPEIMYRRDEVNPACLKCHTRSKMDKDAHEEFFAGKAKEKHCTDCHGKHRLTERKCKWK